MIKILGAVDLICAVLIILVALKIELPWILIFGAGIYLLLKVLIFIFSFNLGSAIDLFACFCLLSSLFFVIPSLILYIGALILGQKGFFSLI